MEVVERACRSSEDARKLFTFYLLRSRDWCNIIPITEEGKIVLVKQFRIGVDQHTLEIPGGVTDPQDPDVQSAAIREMEEETGYRALPGARCLPVGWAYPNPAIMNNRCHYFVVGPVRKHTEQNLDAGEMIEVEEVSIDEIPNKISQGEINHALILNAFFLFALQSKEFSETLAAQLRQFTRVDS
jgi:8-oxo-dGTP pyrophosphatase MutT (NUDIX family)